MEFGRNHCRITDASGKLRAKGSLVDKLYKLDCEDVPNGQTSVASTGSGDLWHQRLGHVHVARS